MEHPKNTQTSQKREVTYESSMFVGGIKALSSKADVKDYFNKFYNVSRIIMKINQKSGLNSGYAFLYFDDPEVIPELIKKDHYIDGRKVECKVSMGLDHNKEESNAVVRRKIFVKKLHLKVDDDELKRYFGQFGEVKNAFVLYGKDKSKSKGFGYVEFVNESVIKSVLQTRHIILRKEVKCTKFTIQKTHKSKNAAMQKSKENDAENYRSPLQQYSSHPNLSNFGYRDQNYDNKYFNTMSDNYSGQQFYPERCINFDNNNQFNHQNHQGSYQNGYKPETYSNRTDYSNNFSNWTSFPNNDGRVSKPYYDQYQNYSIINESRLNRDFLEYDSNNYELTNGIDCHQNLSNNPNYCSFNSDFRKDPTQYYPINHEVDNYGSNFNQNFNTQPNHYYNNRGDYNEDYYNMEGYPSNNNNRNRTAPSFGQRSKDGPYED